MCIVSEACMSICENTSFSAAANEIPEQVRNLFDQIQNSMNA